LRSQVEPNWIDVVKSASHQQSQNEIGSDNPCSRQLSGKTPGFQLAAPPQ
jgi:hypothetical protein